MPNMNITYQGGTYELVIDNAAAVELVDDAAVVQLLAQSMSDGIATVVANAGDIFLGGDAIPEEQIAALFADTDVLLLEGATIFDAAAMGMTLLDTITAAGSELLLALG